MNSIRKGLNFVAALALAGCASNGSPSPPTSDPGASATTTQSTSQPTPPIATTPAATDGPWITYGWASGRTDYALWLMRPDGSGAHPLLKAGSPNAYHPDWSPDGTRIVYETQGPKAIDLTITDVDGSKVTVLVDRNAECGTECGDVRFPAWSHDGSSIAFVRYDVTGNTLLGSELEVIEIATGKRRVVYTAAPLTALKYPRWSPDDASIVFESMVYPDDRADAVEGLRSSISVVDAAATNGTAREVTPSNMWATYPDWQPDGDLIVFSTYDLAEFQATDEPSNLYTVRADGSGMTQITTYGRAQERATGPTWTPDGQRIIFTLVGQDPKFDMPRRTATINPDGTDLTVLNDGATHPRLQPTAK